LVGRPLQDHGCAATVKQIADIERMGLTKAQHVVDGLTELGDVSDASPRPASP
jgi:hypothetical protein